MKELRGKLIADRIKGECLDFVGKYNGILPALAVLRVGEKEDDIAYDEYWQCIDKHGAGCIACRLNFTTEDTCERKDH